MTFFCNNYEGDIYTNHVYSSFYKMMINKKTRQWDGTIHNKSDSEASMKSEKQNYKILLVQLELWSRV